MVIILQLQSVNEGRIIATLKLEIVLLVDGETQALYFLPQEADGFGSVRVKGAPKRSGLLGWREGLDTVGASVLGLVLCDGEGEEGGMRCEDVQHTLPAAESREKKFQSGHQQQDYNPTITVYPTHILPNRGCQNIKIGAKQYIRLFYPVLSGQLCLQYMDNTNLTQKFPFELGTAFPCFASFLPPLDRLAVASTCRLLRDLIIRPHIWHTLQIKDLQNTTGQHWQPYLEWVARFMQQVEPQHISISITSQDYTDDKSLLALFLQPRPFVQALSMRSNSTFLHIAVASACPNLQRLTLHSNIISDYLLQSMLKHCPKVSQIEINADALQFTGENMQNYIRHRLNKLVLKPYQLNYRSLLALLAREEVNEIVELEVDVEECDEELLPKIIDQLRWIRRLRLYHMEKFYNAEGLAKNMSKDIVELTLTKCYNLDMGPIIPKIASPQLLHLDLTEAVYLNDSQIFILAERAHNLVSLNLSWCNELTNNSVRVIVEKCLKLQHIVLNGVKSLNDSAFAEYVGFKESFQEKEYDEARYQFKKEFKMMKYMSAEQFCSQEASKINLNILLGESAIIKPKTLILLKHLECNSCNNVSDCILKIVCCFSLGCSVINYYGQDLGLLNINQLFEDDFY